MKKQSKARKAAAYLDQYKLDSRVLQKYDRKSSRPRMTAGEERDTGVRIILKEWPKDASVQNDDLREIWKQEIRQLHRLAGYPGAREYIVMLQDSSEDAEAFFLVLNPGQRVPLATLLDSPRCPSWLSNPRPWRSRLRLWRDLKRLVSGLEILHTQGLLHRNLDEWAVFTTGGDEPDFQLSGFEWSITLSGVAEKLPPKLDVFGNEVVVHSFLEDWSAFGALACKILGINSADVLSDRQEKREEALRHVVGAERDLLLTLLRGEQVNRLDGELVNRRIDAIISQLTSLASGSDAKLFLTLLLGLNTSASESIRAASNGQIEISDISAQIDFVRADLAETRLLMSVPSDEDGVRRLSLVGRSLVYRLNAFDTSGRASWDIAFCGGVSTQRPTFHPALVQRDLIEVPLEVLALGDARKRAPSIQGKSAKWDRLIPLSSTVDRSAGLLRYQGLVMLQVLEALQVVTEIWPVEVVDEQTEHGRTRIAIRPRVDAERERLSEALGIAAPARRMSDAFDSDSAFENDWMLTEVGTLGEPNTDGAAWRFVERTMDPSEGATYVFEGAGAALVGENMFLREGGYVGQDRLLRRRIKALRALRDHVELLSTLADPRVGVRKTHDDVVDEEHLKSLDASKRLAFRELWGVLPLYLVQGPPGVGKTRLVREVVEWRFKQDPTSRLLLTAQSHHAVDHLLEEVAPRLTSSSEPLICVRTRSKKNEVGITDYDLRSQAKGIAERFADSKLAQNASREMRRKIELLRQSFGSDADEDDEVAPRQLKQDRSLEALLLRAAHLVFSSTNAGDLERLIEERSQFDWTLVEEAGKATGVELVAPLLLSHRRLMIGDHKQLPPYGAEELKRVLANPDKVREAFDAGRPFISRPFRDAGMDDVLDDITADDFLVPVCGDAAASLFLFETLVEGEFSASAQSRPKQPIATRLSLQHRMHPAIARLVSDGFYDRKLLTDDDAVRRFKDRPSPVVSTDATRLPQSPIVFVDMPYVQSTMGKRDIERRPPWHNREEIDAVVDVLRLLKPRDETPTSLAILTPYWEQVKRIKSAVLDLPTDDLTHLKSFIWEGDESVPVGTVDSFQGSEADLVIISLVRNNHHTGRRALGFLSDFRRMNVLLSRAKSKLVLVGSWEFLRARAKAGVEGLEFLGRVCDSIQAMTKERDEKGIPLATIHPVARLKSASR